MSDCLFCRIVARELPSIEVASTGRSYAFRDTHPAAPTHVLVVPRTHVTNAAELTDEHEALVTDLLTTAREVARTEGILESGYRLVFNIGRHALNSVDHLHLHVLGGRQLGGMV